MTPDRGARARASVTSSETTRVSCGPPMRCAGLLLLAWLPCATDARERVTANAQGPQSRWTLTARFETAPSKHVPSRFSLEGSIHPIAKRIGQAGPDDAIWTVKAAVVCPVPRLFGDGFESPP